MSEEAKAERCREVRELFFSRFGDLMTVPMVKRIVELEDERDAEVRESTRLRKVLLILDQITANEMSLTGNEPEEITPTLERWHAEVRARKAAEERLANPAYIVGEQRERIAALDAELTEAKVEISRLNQLIDDTIKGPNAPYGGA